MQTKIQLKSMPYQKINENKQKNKSQGTQGNEKRSLNTTIYMCIYKSMCEDVYTYI